MSKYVVYYRVSTKRQGESGLGLEAQKRDVNLFLKNYTEDGSQVIGEFTDIDSGTNNDRHEYQRALDLANKEGASILVAKLDRLGRKVSEISRVMEVITVKVACMPFADNFQLHLYAALAEQEREFISKRTKAALQSAKSRGVKLGRVVSLYELTEMGKKSGKEATKRANQFAEKIKKIVMTLRKAGESLRGIAEALNVQGFKTQRGKEWTAAGVRNILMRLDSMA
ncbi:recombinase family protein [Vibrio fortis]